MALTYDDLRRSLQALKEQGGVTSHSMTVSSAIFAKFKEEEVTREASLFGFQIFEGVYLPPDAYIEHFHDHDLIHLPNSQIKVENPRMCFRISDLNITA